MDPDYEVYEKDQPIEVTNSSKPMGWNEHYSRRIFATDGGCFVNGLAYFSSLIFMEEVCIVTVIALHFLLFKQTDITIGYSACFLANLIVALIAKKVIAKPRPNPDEIPPTSKSMFFRKKQSFNASCPSGDTIQAVNLVVFAFWCLPSFKFWIVFPLGLMVPASRVYLCCHWITDTLAGWGFASVVTTATVFALRTWTNLQI
jgi:membrane-associated phospholipid phosphatase